MKHSIIDSVMLMTPFEQMTDFDCRRYAMQALSERVFSDKPLLIDKAGFFEYANGDIGRALASVIMANVTDFVFYQNQWLPITQDRIKNNDSIGHREKDNDWCEVINARLAVDRERVTALEILETLEDKLLLNIGEL